MLLYGNVDIIKGGVCKIRVATAIYRNIRPFFLSTGVIYVGKRGATIKRSVANTCHTIGDYYTFQRGAAIKRFEVNFFNTIGDYYTFQRGATIKCIGVNTCHTIGDFYTCQRGATVEYRIANDCYTIGNHNLGEQATIGECKLINFISFTIIVFGKCKLAVVTYIIEKIIYTFISIEEIIIFVNYRAFSVMYFFCIICYASIINTTNSNAKRRYDFNKLIATRECIATNVCYAIGKFYTSYTCATRECTITNACYAIGNFYTS